jgi:hypothetical protein
MLGAWQVEPYEPVEQAINIAIAGFALLLLALSLSAYRRTRVRRTLYAAVAFGLFAVQRLFEFLEETVPDLDTPLGDLVVSGMTLAVLVLFFLAIVTKE